MICALVLGGSIFYLQVGYHWFSHVSIQPLNQIVQSEIDSVANAKVITWYMNLLTAQVDGCIEKAVYNFIDDVAAPFIFNLNINDADMCSIFYRTMTALLIFFASTPLTTG